MLGGWEGNSGPSGK